MKQITCPYQSPVSELVCLETSTCLLNAASKAMFITLLDFYDGTIEEGGDL